MQNPSGDRRPIAARDLQPVIALANWLVRYRVSANAISLAGMICAVIAGFVLAAAPGYAALWLLGAVLVQLRLLANMLDGMVAVGRGIASRLGEIFNEVPDRISDTAILIGLGVAANAAWLGLAAALAAMATAYIRAVGKGLGQASDFCGPMAKPHRMFVVTIVAVWCALAPAALAQPVPQYALYVILVLSLLTTCRRLARLVRALNAGAG